MKQILLFALSLMLCSAAWAQTATLTGKVTDAKTKEALMNATVQTSATNGAVTDLDGNYTLQVPAGANTVEFSFVGYDPVTQKISLKAGETQTLDISLGEKENILAQTVITSSKFARPLSEVTVSMDVIKPSLIANSASASIDKALEKVPGVNIIDGQANIRGGSGWSYGAGSRVLLLVNDMPALAPDAGFTNWNDVPVENIEQVEVVKGAASALYGSSAMNGIINIRTAFAKSTPVTSFATFGTLYDTPRDAAKQWWGKGKMGDTIPFEYGASFVHRQKFGKLDVAYGAYALRNQRPRWGDRNEYFRQNLFTRYRISDGLSAGINFNFNMGNSASFFLWNGDSSQAYMPLRPLGGAPVLTPSKVLRFMFDPYINYTDKAGNNHKLLTRWSYVNNENANNQSNASNWLYGEYQFMHRFEKADMSIVAGVVGSQTSVVGKLYGSALDGGPARYTGSNAAGYVQLEKKFHLGTGKWHFLNVSVGGRYEYNRMTNEAMIDSIRTADNVLLGIPGAVSIAADDWNEARPVFRAGFNYQPAEYTWLRASIGQGYRYPTIAERFVQTKINILGIYPNAGLRSETGISSEIAIKQGFKISNWMGYADLAVFQNSYQNMMEFTFGGASSDVNQLIFGFESANIGDTKILGSEVTLAGQGKILGKETTVLAGYTYIDPSFVDFNLRQQSLSSSSNNVLKYRSRHTGKLDIETRFAKWFSAGAAIQYNSPWEAIDYVFLDDKPITDPKDPHYGYTTGFLGGLLAPGMRNYWEKANKGFTLLDFRVAFYPVEKFKISFLAKNILNEEYIMRPALLEPPRNYTLRLDVSF